jgi:hypothetical protein
MKAETISHRKAITAQTMRIAAAAYTMWCAEITSWRWLVIGNSSLSAGAFWSIFPAQFKYYGFVIEVMSPAKTTAVIVPFQRRESAVTGVSMLVSFCEEFFSENRFSRFLSFFLL